MRKIIILTMVLLALTGCSYNNQEIIRSQEIDIKELKEEIENLETQKGKLLKDVQDIKVERNVAKYIITLKISQSHLTLDLGKHMKDVMNTIEIQLPVDKEFYESVNQGELLDSSFRLGSALLEGSWGNWKVEIIKKEIM